MTNAAIFGLILGLGISSGSLSAQVPVKDSTTVKTPLPCSGKLGVGTFVATAWSVAAQSSTVGSGGGQGGVSVNPLSLTKAFDECSSALFGAAVKGTLLKDVTLTESAGTVTILVVKLEDVQIRQYSLGDGGDSVSPAETLALVYGRITISNPVNGSSFCYDVRRNGPC